MGILVRLSELAEAHGDSFLEEFTSLLSNPAHWAFEAVSDIAFFLLGMMWARSKFNDWFNARIARHDEVVHGGAHPHTSHSHTEDQEGERRS